MTAVGPYRGAILDHFRRPRNYGALPNASAEAEGTNPLCGDRVRVAIRIDAATGRIVAARFTANACAICVAAASLLTERLGGSTIAAARQLGDDDVATMLGDLVPVARWRCATLPLETLHRALASLEGVAREAGEQVIALLLAAGRARRFGGAQKLLAPVPDEHGELVPLVRRTAAALKRGGVARIVVVLGREADTVQGSLAGLGLEFTTNEEYESGMSSSLRAGLRAGISRWPDAKAVMVALGDQPLDDETIVRSILGAFSTSDRALIIAPRYGGVRGNPVLFARDVVPELSGVMGDRGGRDVIDRDPARVVYVDFDIPTPTDVDTPDDLERLQR